MSHQQKVAAVTVALSLSGACFVLSFISALATFDRVWEFIGWVQLEVSPKQEGHTCGLCGMSRAFRKIWQGNFQSALQMNPFSHIAFGFMVVGDIIGVVLYAFIGMGGFGEGRET